MSGEQIVQNCSPTLAGIKTGNLFSYEYSSKIEIYNDVCEFNNLMKAKGIQMIPLKFTNKRVLLYVFRPDKLKEDLKLNSVKNILTEYGYSDFKIYKCLNVLKKRLETLDEFPHEIGLFLSYPPEDVQGFINNTGNNYKLAGLWKVYGDANKAKDTFAKYKKCTQKYCCLLNEGFTVFDLAV